MPAISANNITYLRQPYHRITNLKLNLFELVTTATAKINQASFTYPLLDLTVDNASVGFTALNTRFPMFDITDSNGDIVHRGVIRRFSTTNTELQIAYQVEGDAGMLTRETALTLADDQDITIYKTRIPFAFLSRFDSGTNEILKMGDIDLGTTFPQTEFIEATGILGAWQQANADAITGEASFVIDASNSYSWIGGTLTYLHTLDTGMSITSGVDTDATITIKGTAGQYLHACRINDSLTPTAYDRFVFRYLFINDDTIYPAFSDRYATTIVSDNHTKTGREITVQAYGQDAIDKVYVGAPILLTYDIETSADSVTWDTLEDDLGRRTYSGYVRSFTEIRNDSDLIIGVTFTVQGALDFSSALPVANQYLNGRDSVSTWQETLFANMHVGYWGYYISTTNTRNLHSLHDYDYGDLDDFKRSTVGMPAGDIKSAFLAMTNLALGNTGCTSDGRLLMSRNPVLEDSTYRNALATIWTFNDTDIRDDISYSRESLYRVGQCEGRYSVYIPATTSDLPYRGRWGVFAPAHGVGFEKMQDFVALSSTDGLDRIGHRFAEINAPTPEFTIKTRGLIGDFIEPVWGEWIALNVGSYDPLATEIYNSNRAVPKQVTRSWNFDGAYPTCEIDVLASPETTGTQATSLPFEVSETGGMSPSQWTAILDFTYANGGFQAYSAYLGAITASYSLGVGWGTTDIRPSATLAFYRLSVIYLTFASRLMTSITVTYNYTKGSFATPDTAFSLAYNPTGTFTTDINAPTLITISDSAIVNGTGLTQTWSGNQTMTGIRIGLATSVQASATYSGSALITKIELSGYGSNPFLGVGVLPLPS